MGDGAKWLFLLFSCFVFCLTLLCIGFGVIISYYILSTIKADTWIWVIWWISMPLGIFCHIALEIIKSVYRD